ncbi:cytochrome-c peroxidase [Botryobacter ruber]|uniref:cytochrome-c peroxidase n=1 Tax=Botryobacter ruber TaxID=2171629 RepID=UPI000E0B0D6B|nr:cytochrome c peroxidase [Botryobacter ruber]
MIFNSLFNRKINLKQSLLLLSLCLFLGVTTSSFKKTETSGQVAGAVRQRFMQDVANLQQEAGQLTQTLQLLEQEQLTLAQAQQDFIKVKQAYKQVEFLVEYLDPELAKHINGAPIPKVVVEKAEYQAFSSSTPNFGTFQPEGLQVLEELLFAESFSQGMAKEAVVLAITFEEKTALLANSLYKQPLTDKQVLESMREELLRVMTMGITGFDAPATVHVLENAATALQPVLANVKEYDKVAGGKAKEQTGKAARLLEQVIRYLQQHPDFDSFDRLYFIKELADPAYASLTAMQQVLAYELPSVAKPVNDRATSLFSPDFLQTAYYAKQDRKEQQPELVALGKLLFFDPVLSANNERSCASCHAPDKAFADGRARSVAFDFNGTVKRNSPTLLNAVYSTAYFWDGRARYLQDQVPDVVANADELHGNYEEVVRKLAQSRTYRKLFRKAFAHAPNSSLSVNTINRAIAAYVQSLTALNSPFDRYMRGQTEALSAPAKRGFNLFMGKAGCATCHFAPVFNGTVPPRFTESESEVLGVPAAADFAHAELDADIGRAGIIPAAVFRHSFKTPTVRNAALTAPYMHNGAFARLEEVVEFYNLGGGAGIGLEVPNQTLPDTPLNLTQQEKEDLVAFMESLTDTTAVSAVPDHLPLFPAKLNLNERPVGGRY